MRVARVLKPVVGERAVPDEIVMDNGPELTRKALDQWAYCRGVRLRFIAPGKPQQNGFVESFNGTLRHTSGFTARSVTLIRRMVASFPSS